jgi:halimadienyl-diphosphate synthase
MITLPTNYLVDEVLHAPDQLSQCMYSIAIAALVPGRHQAACLRWLRENYVNTYSITAELSWQDTYISSYATALALWNAGDVNTADGILLALQVNRNESAKTETLTFGGLVGALDRFSMHAFGFAIQHSAAVQLVVESETRKWQALMKWDRFFNPEVSIAGFGAECLYGLPIDLDLFVAAYSFPDGSITRSPAASAMTALNYLHRGLTPPPALMAYIETLNPEARTVGVFDDLTNFLTAWTLLYDAGANHTLDYLPQVENLRVALARNPRIGAAGDFITPELDTGSVAMLAVDWPVKARQQALEAVAPLMFDGRVYRTFLFERNASTTTNIHVLAAWPANPHADSIFGWLEEVLDDQLANWLCKWHVSPYYVVGEVGRLFAGMAHPVAEKLSRRAIEMLFRAQRDDGGWGILRATTEETAYAVLALLRYYEDDPENVMLRQVLIAAYGFLNRSPDYTPLWIGKSLYCLRPLVRALQHIAREKIEAYLTIR